MKVTRKIIEINEDLCDGCGLCVPSCAEGAIQIIDGKARLVAEKYCDGLGACLGECPQGALKITEREAEDFDYVAVGEYLNSQSQPQNQVRGQPQSAPQSQAAGQAQGQPSHVQNPAGEPDLPLLACGCPSTHVQSFKQTTPCQGANNPVEYTGTDRHAGVESCLSHWPVQIKLVPPSAPFLNGADLLVLADCTAVTYPALHRDFLPGKAVLMGCPKFDNVEEYIRKFSSIFKAADIRRITILMMEVPCCSGLSTIIEKGLADAGKHISIEKVTITTCGKVLCGKN